MKRFYERYLSSPHWKSVRRAFIKAVGNYCSMCGKPNANVVHHRVYNLYNEAFKDLQLLCADCHNHIHKHRKKKKQFTRNKYNPYHKTPKKVKEILISIPYSVSKQIPNTFNPSDWSMRFNEKGTKKFLIYTPKAETQDNPFTNEVDDPLTMEFKSICSGLISA